MAAVTAKMVKDLREMTGAGTVRKPFLLQTATWTKQLSS
jgi:translation elongation factor EF-Ts